MNTYADIVAGYDALFATIPAIKRVLWHMPSTIHTDVLLYTDEVLTEYEATEAGQVVKHLWRMFHTLVVPIQDPQGAKDALVSIREQVLTAVRNDPRLGNRLTTGYTRIVRGAGRYETIGEITCAAYEFVSESFFK